MDIERLKRKKPIKELFLWFLITFFKLANINFLKIKRESKKTRIIFERSKSEHVFWLYIILGSPYFLNNITQNWWSTAEKNSIFNVISKFTQWFCNFLFVNISDKSIPIWFNGFINRKVYFQLRISFFILFEFIVQENIILCSVSKK